jgi:hypothetical protein
VKIDYDELKRIARETRAELIERGEIDMGRQRVRRKPRDPEKLELLYTMARDRLEQYPPYRDDQGRLILPFFR